MHSREQARKRQREKTFINPKIKAGILRRPQKNGQEITPENTRPHNAAHRTDGNDKARVQCGVTLLSLKIEND